MPDITMCEGKDCPLKETCKRYKETPNEYRQSYFINPPYSFLKKSCDMYWGVSQENIFNQLKEITNEK